MFIGVCLSGGGAASSPHLALLHRGGVLVAHGADLHAPLPLAVALVEELLHDAVGPLAVQLQGLGGVAQVRTVHHVTQNLPDAERKTRYETSNRIDYNRIKHLII